jgi:hypothetical protein
MGENPISNMQSRLKSFLKTCADGTRMKTRRSSGSIRFPNGPA